MSERIISILLIIIFTPFALLGCFLDGLDGLKDKLHKKRVRKRQKV